MSEVDAEGTTGANGDAEATEAAAEEQGPRDELREGHLAVLQEALGDKVVGSHIVAGSELWIRVERVDWVESVATVKDRLRCTFFDFLSAIDWMPSPWGRYEDALLEPTPGAASNGPGIPVVDPATIESGYAGGDTRFQVFCRLADIRHKDQTSVILKADVPEDDFTVPTLTKIFAGANWHERECWEMFGITFDGHPGLRHLYLPGAFEGHPLRKDFPLVARMVKPWPGIVDVEPMPESADPEAAEGEGEETAAAEEGDT
jgi:NADH-quinone oxidoreductase subunit C